MCSKKSYKTEESNKKRLESLNERLNEFNLKKKLVRLSLRDLVMPFYINGKRFQYIFYLALFTFEDSSKKPKKIIFNDDDENAVSSSHDEHEVVKPKKAKNDADYSNQEKKELFAGKDKKMKLIDSDSDEDADNERTMKILESKANLDQKKANKVNIYIENIYINLVISFYF